MTRLLAVILVGGGLPFLAAEPPAPVNAKVTGFELTNPATGKSWSFEPETREAKATVLLFLNTGCPVSNAYMPKLLDLHKRYSEKGVVFAALFSAPTDSGDSLKKFAKDYALPFPVLGDDRQLLATKLKVERLPAVFVLDAGRSIRYAGRIDDQFAPGVHRVKATTQELVDALNAVLDGQEVNVPHTAAAGCVLTVEKAAKSSELTFHKHVAPIVQNRCQGCHRPGEAGPFALMTYKDVKGWSGMIEEVVDKGIMPPWSADAPRGHFSNDRRLSDAEKKTLLNWIEAGCPEGNPADAPPPRQFVEGWRFGREPDEILRMKRAVTIPATTRAGMAYQYVEVGEPFAEDKWITGAEVRPEFRPAVHHIIAFLIPPGGTMFDVAGDNFGTHLLGAYVPGDQPMIAPPGMARKVPKGSRILFELHYTPMGKAGSDRSMIGLCYSKEPPKHELKSDAIFNGRLRIPPGDANYQISASQTFRTEATLLWVAPHMHVRGKAFRYELKTPNGKTETILNVPKYDFNWQVSYDFAEPRVLPAGSRITCTAAFDNSDKNPFNPDPTKQVRWGQQTWQEMMIGFVTYYEK